MWLTAIRQTGGRKAVKHRGHAGRSISRAVNLGRAKNAATIMTSRPPATPYYGPINPALLGGFEWEDDETPAQVHEPTAATTSTPRTPGLSLLRYLPFNTALLGGFGDDEQKAAVTPATAANGGNSRTKKTGETPTPAATSQAPPPLRGSRWFLARALPSVAENIEAWRRGVTEDDAAPEVPPEETSADLATPTISSNPYQAAIEDKQNAMTVAFLRGQESAAPDDLGYV